MKAMRKFLRNLVFILGCLFLMSTIAFASENIMPLASNYIFGTNADIIAGNKGELTISFHLGSPAPMTELGASSIDIYENNGKTTRWVKTVYSTDEGYENMMGSGMYYGSNITYTGTIGYDYYAKIHFVARNSSGGDTVTSTTPTVTAKR